MEVIEQMIPRPKSPEEANAMLVALMKRYVLNGDAGVDVVVRNRVKRVPIRQIAREDRCDRDTVKHRLDSFDEAVAIMQSAIRSAGGLPKPTNWV